MAKVTRYFKQLDGFHNVIMQSDFSYGLECISKFYWRVECDEFVYTSPYETNWSDQIWQKAKNMYKREVKNVVQS